MKQKYLVKLSDGSTINIEGTINAEEYTQVLNSHQVAFINIGGYILQKHMIQMIAPITDSTEVVSE